MKVPGSESTAEQVRRRVVAGGERFWRHEDFEGLSPSGVATTLSRLAREGELQRVRKGVYFRPRQTVIGPSIPGATAAIASSLRTPIHPAGLSAANVLGLSTQNPARGEFATPASDPPTALAGSRVRTRRPRSRATLTSEEGALLELLRDRATTSDLAPAETAQRLQELLSDGERFARLAQAASEEPPRVRAMLGALGELAGAEEQHVRALRKSLNPLSRFDFGMLSTLPNARDWQAK
ncbi:MAG: AbiEi antitoxin N-terminal domain-containing protein [Actinobacteria bacterium]|nr:AbiEi antitoxin N-terminal domain-containing protein [Actinomycetota bacterium]